DDFLFKREACFRRRAPRIVRRIELAWQLVIGLEREDPPTKAVPSSKMRCRVRPNSSRFLWKSKVKRTTACAEITIVVRQRSQSPCLRHTGFSGTVIRHISYAVRNKVAGEGLRAGEERLARCKAR